METLAYQIYIPYINNIQILLFIQKSVFLLCAYIELIRTYGKLIFIWQIIVSCQENTGCSYLDSNTRNKGPGTWSTYNKHPQGHMQPRQSIIVPDSVTYLIKKGFPLVKHSSYSDLLRSKFISSKLARGSSFPEQNQPGSEESRCYEAVSNEGKLEHVLLSWMGLKKAFFSEQLTIFFWCFIIKRNEIGFKGLKPPAQH